MKKKTLVTVALALVIVLGLVSFSQAANTVTRRGLFIEIVPDGTTAWDSSVSYPDGLVIEYIAFSPSNAADVLYLREGVVNGPGMTPVVRANTNLDPSIIYTGGGLVHPYLKATGDCTFTTPANVRILIKIR